MLKLASVAHAVICELRSGITHSRVPKYVITVMKL